MLMSKNVLKGGYKQRWLNLSQNQQSIHHGGAANVLNFSIGMHPHV
jgi:hypothetical protein